MWEISHCNVGLTLTHDTNHTDTITTQHTTNRTHAAINIWASSHGWVARHTLPQRHAHHTHTHPASDTDSQHPAKLGTHRASKTLPIGTNFVDFSITNTYESLQTYTLMSHTHTLTVTRTHEYIQPSLITAEPRLAP